MVRRVLSTLPEVRWCPAPDCGFALLAASTCVKCPKLTCMRDACQCSFCYNCRSKWHEGVTCEEAAVNRFNFEVVAVATNAAAAAAAASSSSTSGSTSSYTSFDNQSLREISDIIMDASALANENKSKRAVFVFFLNRKTN